MTSKYQDQMVQYNHLIHSAYLFRPRRTEEEARRGLGRMPKPLDIPWKLDPCEEDREGKRREQKND